MRMDEASEIDICRTFQSCELVKLLPCPCPLPVIFRDNFQLLKASVGSHLFMSRSRHLFAP